MVVQDYKQTVANYDGAACSITLNVLINFRETKLVRLNEKKSIEGLLLFNREILIGAT